MVILIIFAPPHYPIRVEGYSQLLQCEAPKCKTCVLGWLKIWSYLNLVSLAGEMRPFPSQMITLKSGGNQMKFTHGRNPPSFPIENIQEGIWPLQLPILYNRNEVGLRPWLNFVWSSPDFRVTIYDENGHISPARKTRFGFDHILSHPID